MNVTHHMWYLRAQCVLAIHLPLCFKQQPVSEGSSCEKLTSEAAHAHQQKLVFKQGPGC